MRRKAAAAGAGGQPFHLVRDLCERLVFHAADDGCKKTALDGNCDADVGAFVKRMPRSVKVALASGTRCSASPIALMMKSFTDNL